MAKANLIGEEIGLFKNLLSQEKVKGLIPLDFNTSCQNLSISFPFLPAIELTDPRLFEWFSTVRSINAFFLSHYCTICPS